MLTRKQITALLTATALSAATTVPVQAQSIEDLKAQLAALAKRIEELEKKQETAEKASAPKVSKSEPALAIATQDGLFEMNIRGRVFADAGWGSDDDGTMDFQRTEFRAARIGVEGKAWKNIKYRFEADFAHNSVSLSDVFLQYAGSAGSVKVGHFKTPNSLEEQTSARHTTFMERASFTDAFNLSRMIGVGYSTGGDVWTLNAGVFSGSAASGVENEADAIAARLTYGGSMSDATWMVGASARFQNNGDNDLYRYRQRPHNHLSDRFVATGRIAEKDSFFGVEAAVQSGPFHAAGEWATLTANDGGSQGRDATFSGGYFEAGWFITGETKPLKLAKGAFDRPKIDNPIHKGGFGAWQVAAKYDYIDLTDNGVFGGEQTTWILGVNWYLNRHTRFMANYSHSSIKDAFDVAANGADGENKADTLGIRFQIDW